MASASAACNILCEVHGFGFDGSIDSDLCAAASCFVALDCTRNDEICAEIMFHCSNNQRPTDSVIAHSVAAICDVHSKCHKRHLQQHTNPSNHRCKTDCRDSTSICAGNHGPNMPMPSATDRECKRNNVHKKEEHFY